jgi:hypothetical protein
MNKRIKKSISKVNKKHGKVMKRLAEDKPTTKTNGEMEEVTVDLDDKTLAFIARYAHGKDITINKAICEIIIDQLRKDGIDV